MDKKNLTDIVGKDNLKEKYTKVLSILANVNQCSINFTNKILEILLSNRKWLLTTDDIRSQYLTLDGGKYSENLPWSDDLVSILSNEFTKYFVCYMSLPRVVNEFFEFINVTISNNKQCRDPNAKDKEFQVSAFTQFGPLSNDDKMIIENFIAIITDHQSQLKKDLQAIMAAKDAQMISKYDLLQYVHAEDLESVASDLSLLINEIQCNSNDTVNKYTFNKPDNDSDATNDEIITLYIGCQQNFRLLFAKVNSHNNFSLEINGITNKAAKEFDVYLQTYFNNYQTSSSSESSTSSKSSVSPDSSTASITSSSSSSTMSSGSSASSISTSSSNISDKHSRLRFLDNVIPDSSNSSQTPLIPVLYPMSSSCRKVLTDSLDYNFINLFATLHDDYYDYLPARCVLKHQLTCFEFFHQKLLRNDFTINYPSLFNFFLVMKVDYDNRRETVAQEASQTSRRLDSSSSGQFENNNSSVVIISDDPIQSKDSEAYQASNQQVTQNSTQIDGTSEGQTADTQAQAQTQPVIPQDTDTNGQTTDNNSLSVNSSTNGVNNLRFRGFNLFAMLLLIILI